MFRPSLIGYDLVPTTPCRGSPRLCLKRTYSSIKKGVGSALPKKCLIPVRSQFFWSSFVIVMITTSHFIITDISIFLIARKLKKHALFISGYQKYSFSIFLRFFVVCFMFNKFYLKKMLQLIKHIMFSLV